jgi:hypothetical protein
MDERRLDGGFDGGATVVDGTVRRKAGPWSRSVHRLLAHLQDRGFDGAPRPLGVDDLGREIVSYLPGQTVGSRRRLELFLAEHGGDLTADGLLEVLRRRLRDNIDAMRVTARSGDVTYQRMLEQGVDLRLVRALEELDDV